MDKVIEEITKNIGLIVTSAVAILGLIVNFRTNFLRNDKVISGRYLHFKTIREEYKADKTNGYFALQQYLKRRLPVIEMDFIIESPDAFRLLFLVKSAAGKYHFDGNAFSATIRNHQFILPILGYFASAFPIVSMLSFSAEILKVVDLYRYLLLLFIVVASFGPVLAISLININELASARHLETLASKEPSDDRTAFNRNHHGLRRQRRFLSKVRLVEISTKNTRNNRKTRSKEYYVFRKATIRDLVSTKLIK